MNQKHTRLLAAIFTDPARANIAWNDVESLLSGLGATITEGRGSRVRVELKGVAAVFPRPHPRRPARKGVVRALRDYLREADVGGIPEAGGAGGMTRAYG